MNDHDMLDPTLLDELVARTNPVSDARINCLDLAEVDTELVEEITAMPSRLWGRGRSRGTRDGRLAFRLAVGAAAAVVTVMAAIVVWGSEDPKRVDHQSVSDYPTEAVEMAENSPRILVSEAGWPMTDLRVPSPGTGTSAFRDGQLEISWSSVPDFMSELVESAPYVESDSAVVLGREARIFTQSIQPAPAGAPAAMAEAIALLAPEDGQSVAITALIGSEQAFLDLLRTLRVVTVDEWLDAVPREWVDPAIRQALVDQMLAGVPLPESLDAEALRQGAASMNTWAIPFWLEVEVACGWADDWFVADEDGRSQVFNTLADWVGWPMARRLEAEGGTIWTPEVLLAEMAGGTLTSESEAYAAWCNGQVDP